MFLLDLLKEHDMMLTEPFASVSRWDGSSLVDEEFSKLVVTLLYIWHKRGRLDGSRIWKTYDHRHTLYHAFRLACRVIHRAVATPTQARTSVLVKHGAAVSNFRQVVPNSKFHVGPNYINLAKRHTELPSPHQATLRQARNSDHGPFASQERQDAEASVPRDVTNGLLQRAERAENENRNLKLGRDELLRQVKWAMNKATSLRRELSKQTQKQKYESSVP